MPGYFVLLVDINDHDRYAEYVRAVPPTYARYGGRMAIRGPVVEVIEGALEVREDTRLVVLEFESVDQARAWWTSQDYQRIREFREPPVADARGFLVGGIDLSGDAAGGRRRA
jgi:uncharacterized protein (DUF1330 family)